jgi:hypothetical protein
VLNVVPGLGHTAGKAIIGLRHPDIDMTAHRFHRGRPPLVHSAGANLKRVVLEWRQEPAGGQREMPVTCRQWPAMCSAPRFGNMGEKLFGWLAADRSSLDLHAVG